jgi:DNA-binding IclR family transcriptional regulator
MTERGCTTVRALARGLRILGLFDAEHRDWSLDEILDRTDLPRMTAYRLARTLRDEGYLVVDRITGRYALGAAMLTGAYLSESYGSLVTTARPYLESLAEETGESVTLAVEVRGVAVCADMVRSARPNRQEVAIGRIIGDTANAHGKLFAASKPSRERQKIAHGSHVRRTPNTHTDPPSLAAELEHIRRDGVAYDLEERDLGTCAVAAAVRDQMGQVVATVAVVVPAGRFGDEARSACTDAVKRKAGTLSAFLGYVDGGLVTASG